MKSKQTRSKLSSNSITFSASKATENDNFQVQLEICNKFKRQIEKHPPQEVKQLCSFPFPTCTLTLISASRRNKKQNATPKAFASIPPAWRGVGDTWSEKYLCATTILRSLARMCVRVCGTTISPPFHT